ncbi:diguanylate cyclase with PAS/PAC sensor [Faunimonas pinastri]|uniref:diguanylate cyclase n=1 Tax=Faunimonas pinastri TaxID=1855383 RepID=A0A1H9F994_9HYPH|nr:diguanylate cyclase [Faunimonas pinastri]SEQ34516.1 diguanylate cyclase with PAS/PAC sensor [Faunimonas pinastri]
MFGTKRNSSIFRGPRLIAAVVILLILGFCALSVSMLLELRHDTGSRALTGADNLLNAFSQDITRTLTSYDLSLQSATDGLHDPDLLRLTPDLQRKVLFDRAATAKYLGAILVLDAAGNVVLDSGASPPRQDNFSDREYFVAQKERPDVGLYISHPFRRRLTGNDMVIAFSRRIVAPDGSFGGVVVGTLRLDYFKDLFSGATIGPAGAINLFLMDGTYVMRLPYDPDQIGKSIGTSSNFRRFVREGTGNFTASSAVDNVRRIYSFTGVKAFPLVLDVAAGERDIYAGWRKRAWMIGGMLISLCAVAAGFGGLLARELRRRNRAELERRKADAQYRLLADHASDIIMRLDRGLFRTYVSPASLAVLGYTPEELIGGHPRALIHPDDWQAVAGLVDSARSDAGTADTTYRIRNKQGEYIWMEGRYSYVEQDESFIVVLRDVSKRKAAEIKLAALNSELALLAASDGLTGLANRRRFDEALDAECRRASRHGTPLSLLLLDVDRFKLYNDRYGHQAGDTCLQQVAAAVEGCINRPGDLAARYGGEEIVVLLPGTDEAGAAHVAERVRKAIEDLGILHEGNAANGGVVTVSIGVAGMMPVAGYSAENGRTLVAEADRNLYEAKRNGRNRSMRTEDVPRSPVAPVPAREEERLAVLRLYEKAGVTKPSESLDRIARLAATLLNTPTGFVSLVGIDELRLTGRHGIELETVPRDVSFCAHTITGDGLLVIPDTQKDPRFAENPLANGDDAIRFYAGAPLVSREGGQPLGALCVTDSVPRPKLDATDRAILKDLAALVVDDMERRRAGRKDNDSAVA